MRSAGSAGVFASQGVVYPVVGQWPASLPQGCHIVRQVVPTPSTLRPGSYRWYMVRDYAPTVIATVQIHVMSEPFEVVARDTAPLTASGTSSGRTRDQQ